MEAVLPLLYFCAALLAVVLGLTLGYLVWGRPLDAAEERAEEAEERAQAAEDRADERLENAEVDLAHRVDLELAIESGDVDRVLQFAPPETGGAPAGTGGEGQSRAAGQLDEAEAHG